MYHTLRHDDQDVASQFYCMVNNEVTEEEYFECFQCEYQSVEETPMPDHVIGKLLSGLTKCIIFERIKSVFRLY